MTNCFRWTVLVMGGLVAVSGCGPQASGKMNSAEQNPDDAPDSVGCSDQMLTLQRGLAPDVMVVLDRSGSMVRSIFGYGTSKWDQVAGAIQDTMYQISRNIRFGLQLFPTDGVCSIAQVTVPVSDRNAEAISSAIATYPPDSDAKTPTADAVLSAGRFLLGLSEANPKFLLLATDGKPNDCSGDDAESRAVDAVRAVASMGIHTFVIGIATRNSDADSVLGQMAEAGLEPRTTEPRYYSADSAADLATALGSITAQVGCVLPLAMPVRSADVVALTVKGEALKRDPKHEEGWDLSRDGAAIQLYGSPCTNLKDGSSSEIRASFGCIPQSVQ